MKSSIIAFVLISGPALAQTCPEAPDIHVPAEQVFARMQTAPDESTARALAHELWALWTRAPDKTAQALLDEGMARRAVNDLPAAAKAFEALVTYCPDFAEGYNQRAFVRFLSAKYDAALPDLESALALNPRHLAALAGKALTLIALGRHDEAQTALRAALKLNPWLAERHLLRAPKGTDL